MRRARALALPSGDVWLRSAASQHMTALLSLARRCTEALECVEARTAPGLVEVPSRADAHRKSEQVRQVRVSQVHSGAGTRSGLGAGCGARAGRGQGKCQPTLALAVDKQAVAVPANVRGQGRRDGRREKTASGVLVAARLAVHAKGGSVPEGSIGVDADDALVRLGGALAGAGHAVRPGERLVANQLQADTLRVTEL